MGKYDYFGISMSVAACLTSEKDNSLKPHDVEDIQKSVVDERAESEKRRRYGEDVLLDNRIRIFLNGY